MLVNYSTLFILVSWYVIIENINIYLILYLLSKWEISTVFTLCFWKSWICKLQTNKIIILVVKESGPSCWLASVGHKIQIDSTKGTLGLIPLPIDLGCIAILISCFYRLEMHVKLCDIPTHTWIWTSVILGFFDFFAKLENWTSAANEIPISPLAS